MKLTFKDWLITFADTNTEFSDLANDVKRDDNFPDCSDKTVLMDYIMRRVFDPYIHDLMSAAFERYHAQT